MSTKSADFGSDGVVKLKYTAKSTDTTLTMTVTQIYFINTTSSAITYSDYIIDNRIKVEIFGSTVVSGWSGTVAAGATKVLWEGTKSKTYTRTHSDQEDISFAKVRSFMTTGTFWINSIAAKTHYAITYNANNGSGAPTSQTKWYDEPLTLRSTTPTRTGYTFSKWNTAAGGTGTNYAPAASYTKNAAAILYAQWAVKSYTLTYDANGGTVSPTSNSINYGAAYILPTPTRTGYDFNGWWTAASDGTQVTTNTKMGAANTTIYAHWIEKTTTLTYNNGGYGDPPAAVTMYYTQATYATSMSADGWFFDNWVRSDNEETVEEGGLVKAENVVPTALTLTAQWNPATVTITLNDQEATTSGTENFYEKYKIGFYEDEECTELISNIDCPKKTNYEFDGYYSGENGQGNKYIDSDGVITSLTGDFTDFDNPEGVTLYANWIPKIYHILLNNQYATTTGTTDYYEKYGINTYSDVECVNELKQITIPQRIGYTFNGYILNDSPLYIDNRGNILTNTIAPDSTLSVSWEIIQYTITAYANGGTISETSGWSGSEEIVTKSIPYDTAYGTLPIINRLGYTFDGWYTAAEGGTLVSSETKIGNENTNIYAHWTANEYDGYDDYTFRTINTGEVRAIAKTNSSSYRPIPYAIENNTLVITSLQDCFKERTSLKGNLYVNCSAVTNVEGMFDEVSNNICIIFGSEFQEFNTIWDSLITENITYLGAEDNDYYYTADETDSSNHNLNIRVKDKSKEMYNLPALTLNDGTDDWTAATMNQCYKDCINLQGILKVSHNPTSYNEIFNGVVHKIYINCLKNDNNMLQTWRNIADEY